MSATTAGSFDVTRLLSTTLVAAIMLTGCGSSSPHAEQGGVGGEVLVSAAASLTNAFGEIEVAFEQANPDVDVLMNVAGSAALREQILQGAPVDVFASANLSNMDRVAEAGRVDGVPQTFTRNQLQIAVPAGNPAEVSSLEDFANEDLLIGLCAQDVPCGDFGREALANAGVEPAPDTYEPDVRALLTKIEAGELDAGIVYVTDIASTSGRVEAIDIPEVHNVLGDYPIAVLADAPNPAGAAAFVQYVLSEDGQSILADHGFVPR